MSFVYLSDFHPIRPSFITSQEVALSWLIKAHVEAEKKKGTEGEELRRFEGKMIEAMGRFGAALGQIETRGSALHDFSHENWDKMRIYRLRDWAEGADLKERSKVYEEVAYPLFASYYSEEEVAPDQLIHVTCTGYLSPSSAQKIVGERKWGDKTRVVHAYHMGCYAAIPAIRMGSGFLHVEEGARRCDLVHTEFCTLHLNPANHGMDQLVAQALFSDGFIKYSIGREKGKGGGLIFLASHEEVVSHSSDMMVWNLSPWGFEISLAKEIPVIIQRSIQPFVEKLCQKGKRDSKKVLAEALFAVHPGGPKILDYIQRFLGLQDEQIEMSRRVLRECGNMSSATLPHIWEKILTSPEVEDGRVVVSLAFGPGLSIHGSIMKKEI